MRIKPTALSRTLLAACLAWWALAASAHTAPVDAELVLVVDVSKSVSNAEFGQMMAGLSLSFQSQGVIDAIQSGTTGTLAASLIFYTGRNNQAVGVDWMVISDANSAAAFALALANASRPFSQKNTSIANAIDYAVPTFGSETGGPGNGFESELQTLFFVGEGVDDHSLLTNGSREETVQNSRDAALLAGVDVISAMTIGGSGTVDDYFTDNVIGGAAGSNQGTVTNAADFVSLVPALQPTVEQHIGAMPEPGLAALLGAGALPLLLGRRRCREGRRVFRRDETTA